MNQKAFEQKIFEQETLRCLSLQQLRYPAMEQADIVKFVFQAMLGPGHLLSSRDTVRASVAREMAALQPDSAEPLYEVLSPAWCRLNLRGAGQRHFTPDIITEFMFSPCEISFTRQDVFAFCSKLAVADQNLITDESWLPSHSPAYRALYHPAYRVIPSSWISGLPLIQAVQEALIQEARRAGPERILVTIDGPCASGKTTLARNLAALYNAPVVHTDDFVIPHEQKTAERLAVPGGNCDCERLVREVAAPWKQGYPVRYRKYDCVSGRLLPETILPPGRVLFLEGSYCNLPPIRALADVRIFVSASREIREARLIQRESARSLRMFYDRWIPLEDHYFRAYGLPDKDCIVYSALSISADQLPVDR